MKVTRIIALVLLCAAAVFATGCKKDKKKAKDEVMALEYKEFTDAGAYYYGQYQSYDFDMYCLFLLAGNTRIDNGEISGVGTALWLDMNVISEYDKDNFPIIASETYGPARNDFAPNAFLRGMDDPEKGITGSYVYYRPLNGQAQYLMITAGSVTVSNIGKYNIKAEVTAGGFNFTFEYWGDLGYYDMNTGGEEEPYVKPVVFTHGILEKWGMPFENNQLSDYCDWMIRLGGDDINFNDPNRNGAELQLEIITAAGTDDITGSYSVKTTQFNDDTILTAVVPGAALCGYIDDNDGNYYGCWYFPAGKDVIYLGATEGDLIISKSNNKYNIEYDMNDTFEGDGFIGNWTVPLEFNDCTTKSVSSYRGATCRKASPAAAQARRAGESLGRRSITAVGK